MKQLPLPLVPNKATAHDRFVVGPPNADAVTFVHSWPNWSISAAAIYGPAGSGKTHLVNIWLEKVGASCLTPAELDLPRLPLGPVAVENADLLAEDVTCSLGLFHLLERATQQAPVLLTGREAPSHWCSALPDLQSRFRSLVGFEMGAPDEAMLVVIARKLFADHQLAVPDEVVRSILHTVERSPASIKAFVAELDRRALATARPVTLAMVRDVLAEREVTCHDRTANPQ